MTSNNSSTNMNPKRGSFLLNNVRSYWWLALICTVIYGFAGPVYTLLKIDSITQPSRSNYLSASTEESLLEKYAGQMADWFSSEGFIFLYISAIVLAAIIGCVVFFYLQNKRQTNFYHSQPISRTRLFLSQYLTGLFVNVIPLLLMIVISLLITVAYNMGAALDFTGILLHTVYMLLLLFTSYNIAVLAGQLTGTMLTHVILNAVLHFCVPVAAALVKMLFELFFATYNGNPDLLTLSMKFSPFCAAIYYLNTIPFPSTNVMTVTPMAGSMVAVLLILGVAASMLAWVLYQKRPSEATGKALIYPITEPLLKAYLMFVVSIAAGMVFIIVSSKIFFYFAVIVFAIMTHMTCEVIFQRDFKAMGKRMPQCLVILVLIGAIVGMFRFDLIGYDRYLPKPDQVKGVSLVVIGAEKMTRYGIFDEELFHNNYSQDEAVKQSIYELLQPIVEKEQYRGSSFENMNYSYNTEVKTSPIEVKYVLKNGKTVSRYYKEVPFDMLERPYQQLYDQLAYRESLYHFILQIVPEQVRSLSVDNNSSLIFDNRDGGLIEASAIEATTTLLEAYQKDLQDRQFSTLEKIVQHTIELERWLPSRGRYNNDVMCMDLPVYIDDKRTMALLQEMDLYTDPNEDHRDYDRAFIFRCDVGKRDEMRDVIYDAMESADKDGQLTGDDYLKLLEGKAELTGTIADVNAIDSFIQQTNLFKESDLFTKYDETHFALLCYDDRDGENWYFQSFYADTVPEQYQ